MFNSDNYIYSKDLHTSSIYSQFTYNRSREQVLNSSHSKYQVNRQTGFLAITPASLFVDNIDRFPTHNGNYPEHPDENLNNHLLRAYEWFLNNYIAHNDKVPYNSLDEYIESRIQKWNDPNISYEEKKAYIYSLHVKKALDGRLTEKKVEAKIKNQLSLNGVNLLDLKEFAKIEANRLGVNDDERINFMRSFMKEYEINKNADFILRDNFNNSMIFNNKELVLNVKPFSFKRDLKKFVDIHSGDLDDFRKKQEVNKISSVGSIYCGIAALENNSKVIYVTYNRGNISFYAVNIINGVFSFTEKNLNEFISFLNNSNICKRGYIETKYEFYNIDDGKQQNCNQSVVKMGGPNLS